MSSGHLASAVSVILVCALGGCAHRPPRPRVVGNQGIRVDLAATRLELFRAVVRTARDRGWRVSIANPKLGWVEVLEPVVDEAGVSTRRRWLFAVHEDAVTIRMVLAVRRNERWHLRPFVCAGYAYAQERAYAGDVALTLRSSSEPRLSVY
jgi:hypothetical protein